MILSFIHLEIYIHKVLLSSFQQAPVGLNLLLQTALDIQQGLVFLVLALDFCSDFSQLLLHARDLVLQLTEQRVVLALGLSQRGFQIISLVNKTIKETEFI